MTRNVLVVEDAELCRDTLEVALLKLPNLAVFSVTTAEEALQCLASNEVCALVTDLRLPRMDGYQLIEAIRSQPRRCYAAAAVASNSRVQAMLGS